MAGLQTACCSPGSAGEASSPVAPRRARDLGPVPKQDSHQPCQNWEDNSRGSSSAKLVPQDGQARLVDSTVVSRAGR